MSSDFAQLPEHMRILLEAAYDAELDLHLPGLAEQLRKNPRAYERSITCWLEYRMKGFLTKQEARQ